MLTDFTFKNESIQKYFNGDDSYIPSSELIYLHQHPLIRQSFLVEMELMINKTSEMMVRKKMQGPVVQRFIDSTIALGAELPTINQQNAPKILSHLRDVYQLCKSLLH